MRLLYKLTLGRPDMVEAIPYGKKPKFLPAVFSPYEVVRVLAAAVNDRFGIMLQTTYGCGLRIAEVTHLRITDIDSQRMVLHVRNGKGGKDRLLPLSRLLLHACATTGASTAPATGCSPARSPASPSALGRCSACAG